MPNNGAGVLTSGNLQLKFEFDDGGRIEDGIVDDEDISHGYNVAYLPPGMFTKNLKAGSVSGKVKLSPTLTSRGMVNDAVLEFEKGTLVKWSSRSSKDKLDSLINGQPESQRKIDGLTVGLNPVVRYGYGEDRFVSGSLGINGLEFTGIVRNGTLRADQTILVDKGKLLTR